jgi:hypothetical protein
LVRAVMIDFRALGSFRLRKLVHGFTLDDTSVIAPMSSPDKAQRTKRFPRRNLAPVELFLNRRTTLHIDF